MKKLLTLKHWQLFGILIGIPILFEFLIIGSFFFGEGLRNIFFIFPLMMIVSIGLFFGWFYTLGTNLYKKLPPTATMNLKRFKIFLFIPVIYMAILPISMFGIFSTMPSGSTPDSALFALIIPIHFFCMFCMFYCLYFNAKALKTVECQRPLTFSDFAGEFFLIWFFPVGIWILQPRINKLFDTNADHFDDSVFANRNV